MHSWLGYRETVTSIVARLCRLTIDHLDPARNDWEAEFDRRHMAGISDRDALLWKGGFRPIEATSSDWPPAGYVLPGSKRSNRRDCDIRRSPKAQPDPHRWVVTQCEKPRNCTVERDRNPDFTGLRGVGRLLVVRSILESSIQGFDGRIGLHSLPDADRFFDRLGFVSLGADPANPGLSFYELQPTDAEPLIVELYRLEGRFALSHPASVFGLQPTDIEE